MLFLADSFQRILLLVLSVLRGIIDRNTITIINDKLFFFYFYFSIYISLAGFLVCYFQNVLLFETRIKEKHEKLSPTSLGARHIGFNVTSLSFLSYSEHALSFDTYVVGVHLK